MGVYSRVLRPRLLDAAMNTTGTREIRRRVCSGLVGDVLEIGYGSGHNQPYLPTSVERVLAIEPSTVAWELATRRYPSPQVPVVLAAADAQELPLADDSVDSALSTWTLCSIPDPLAALLEIRRVLRPGGALHFVEHGLAPDAGVVRWQRRTNGLSLRVMGCVLDRDIPALLAESGLHLADVSSYYHHESGKLTGYFSEGRATA